MLRLITYRKILFILSIFVGIGSASRQCDPSSLTELQCSDTELCDISTKTCQCSPGYERENSTYCVKKIEPPSQSTPNYSSLVDNHGSGALVAGILTPLFLIIFVICGIYANKKYQLLTWIRNKLNRRGENYDEFMIGQDTDEDDPPLRC